MHSKWKIWDYFKNYKTGIDSSSGIYAFQVFDPLISSLLRQKFPRELFYEQKLPVFTGKDLSLCWFEDNYQTLGLFGNQESYVITQAETLSAESKEFLLNSDLIMDGRFLILFFDKADSLYKELIKKENVNGIEIQAPAFWESDKLLEFLAELLKVQLSYEAKNIILSYVEHTCLEFHNLLTKLSVNYGDKSISKEMLAEVIEKNRIDNFELAKLFGHKKMKDFYSLLVELDPDYEDLRSLFYFLQTHMIKVADPSFIYDKKRKTKYDDQILGQSKLWRADELKHALNFLKNIEMQSKIKNPFIKEELRSAYLRAL
jgi:DNA polymerase III delta subunit